MQHIRRQPIHSVCQASQPAFTRPFVACARRWQGCWRPILLVSGYPGGGHSAIFACESGNSTVYQDVPCQIRQAADVTVKKEFEYPLGMDASWFELPEQANERAFCDRRGCECGLIERKHQSSIALTVADALYMDGSWHRYHSSYDKWLTAPASSSESYVHREEMLNASCHIMMSQLLLKKYADDVMDKLKERVKTAEERGFDSELPCEARHCRGL